jgi:hypothetical protein
MLPHDPFLPFNTCDDLKDIWPAARLWLCRFGGCRVALGAIRLALLRDRFPAMMMEMIVATE